MKAFGSRCGYIDLKVLEEILKIHANILCIPLLFEHQIHVIYD